MSNDETQGNRDLADLLPFYVTGKLPLSDMARIEAALATDAALRRELALVEEEQAATVRANEMLGLPSGQAGERFFAMLEAEPARAASGAVTRNAFAWIGERLQALAPRQLAFAGIAAAVLVIAQAGFIGALWNGGGTIFTQASVSGTAGEGSFAAIAFVPEARLADIAALLAASGATIADGPKPGGLYVLRIGPKDMPKADRDAAIARLGADKALVRFVAPSQ